MSAAIAEVIERTERELVALKKLAEEYGDGITSVTYAHGDAAITLWLVDMPLQECTNVQTFYRNRDAWDRSFAVLFRNVAPGVNIAPKHQHYIDLNLLLQHLRDNAQGFEHVIRIFEKHGGY